MAKLKVPLLSLKATGGLGKLFSLAKRRGRHIIERKPIPPDAKSPAQLFNRLMFTKCIDLWHLLSDEVKQEWESAARPKHMTGYAWYISQCLRPNPGIYLPLLGGTMQGAIDMAKNRLLKLPLPTDAQEAASKAYVDALAPGLHADTHEDGGADEIDVGGLAGLLADDQHVIDAEVLAVAEAIGVAAGLIGVHAGLPAAHHARYTDAEVLTVAEAIGVAADLIGVHAGLPAAHHAAFVLADHTAIGDNAPHHARYADAEADARIAIHAAIAAAHHAAFVLADHTAIGDNAPHHARYADAEADARIAIHAAIAAAHHAAFVLADHTAIGDNAPHHAKYTNDEAVNAMGAKGDANPLHHDRAAEWGAAEHTAIGNGAPHHAKYTNTEAVAAAKTVKLDDFATPDDNTHLNASTTRHGLFKKLDNVIDHFLNGKGNWVEVVAGPTVATGSYVGNDVDGRQITTGFKCSRVVIHANMSARSAGMIPNAIVYNFDGAKLLGGSILHAADGFTVFRTDDGLNNHDVTYYYWAISE